MSALEQDRETARDVPLDMSAEQFRELGYRMVDRVAGWLRSIRDLDVTPGETPTDVREALGTGTLPVRGRTADELLDRAADLLFQHSLFNGHPRFFGYITSPAAPIGVLGDLLASAINANVGAWELSPMASEIERQTLRWIAEMIGYPATGAGVLVSGGNMANFVAFLAARRARADWDVRAKGLAAGPAPLRIYASSETHTWIHKAADLFGHGGEAIRWIATDEDLAMDVEALRRAVADDLAGGARPFLVVGTAGSVSTGAIDPLADLADVCREHGMWFHVDGAYGALAAVAAEAPTELRALALADSIAVDPHKWLYAPLEAGCVLTRDPEALREAFQWKPPYYQFQEHEADPPINFVEHGMQNSRGFRALKVWLALQQAGREGYARMIGDDLKLARRLHEQAAAHPELEAATLSLSIATFRYVPRDLRDKPEAAEYLDKLNAELLRRLKLGGEAFLTNAVVHGRFLLRACIVNFRTTEADVDAVPEIVARLGHEVDAELRRG